MNKLCDKCEYWEGIGDNEGFCHRNPPTQRGIIENNAPLEEKEHGWFVVTDGFDWCGEFKLSGPTQQDINNIIKEVNDEP